MNLSPCTGEPDCPACRDNNATFPCSRVGADLLRRRNEDRLKQVAHPPKASAFLVQLPGGLWSLRDVEVEYGCLGTTYRAGAERTRGDLGECYAVAEALSLRVDVIVPHCEPSPPVRTTGYWRTP